MIPVDLMPVLVAIVAIAAVGLIAVLVLLGVLLSRRPLVAPARIERALRAALGENKATLERNLAAFHAGLALE